MRETGDNAVVSTLSPSPRRCLDFDQHAWDRAVRSILPDVHEVDRDATRIWFHFWPLKLARLARLGDASEAARGYKLDGRFRLSEQLSESVELFHGWRLWPEVRRVVSSCGGLRERREPQDPENLLREVAEKAAAETGVSTPVVLGIAAAATMAWQQLGDHDFHAARGGAPPADRRRSAQAVLARRRARSGGVLRRLLGRPKHTITWDERRGRTFAALDRQNLAMAAARDPEDHRDRDPRCVAGPIPVQCRSGACGYCWIGVIAGGERLSPITAFERQRLEEFGYSDHAAEDETHPPVRLACQCAVLGDATVVIPPWNGVLRGRT
jgi:ferredoxin